MAADCAWRVYVYNLTRPLSDDLAKARVTHTIWHAQPADRLASLKQAFGPGHGPHGELHNSHPHSLTPILEHRLRFSRCRTHDPEKADLFFAPVWPMPRLNLGNAEYPAKCTSISGADEVLRQAEHLRNPAAACRQLCAKCERCRHMSLSVPYRDCSWYWACPTINPLIWDAVRTASLPIPTRKTQV